MTDVTCDEAISDLKTIFEIGKDNGNKCDEGKFLIDKRNCETFEVENKIKEYFSDKRLSDGFCILSGITASYTKFEIVKKG